MLLCSLIYFLSHSTQGCVGSALVSAGVLGAAGTDQSISDPIDLVNAQITA